MNVSRAVLPSIASIGRAGEVEQLRRQFVLALSWASLVLGSVGLPPLIIGGLARGVFNIPGLLGLGGFFVICAVCILLSRRGRVQTAGLILLTTYILAFLALPLVQLLFATIIFILAATLIDWRIYLVANLIVLGAYGYGAVRVVVDNPGVFPPEIFNYTLPLISFSVLSIALRFFLNAAQNALAANRRTTEQLQASTAIERILAQTLDLDSLLSQAAALVQERFAIDRVQIFLMDEGQGQAILAAAAGETSPNSAPVGSRLPLTSGGAVGQVARTSERVLTGVRRDDDETFMLTGLRSRLVFPLQDGNRLVGALDLQSKQARAFEATDVQTLQVLADLLSNGARNARLFESQGRIADENRRLYQQSETALREIERLNGELTRESWQEFVGGGERTPGVTLEQDMMVVDTNWTDALVQAQQERRSVMRMDGEQAIVSVPVMLRGEVIGAIEVEPGEAETAEQAVEMVEAIAQRLAISLENARLYEQAQEATAQEQRINDIAARYQQVATVDDLLRITLDELGQTLGATRGSIRLGGVERDQLETAEEAVGAPA